jgi:hypothetical protein
MGKVLIQTETQSARLYQQRESQDNRRGRDCAGHCRLACRAGSRNSVGKMKEAANWGGLFRGDKTLCTPAFRAFVDMMHEPGFFFLDA